MGAIEHHHGDHPAIEKRLRHKHQRKKRHHSLLQFGECKNPTANQQAHHQITTDQRSQTCGEKTIDQHIDKKSSSAEVNAL